MKRIAFLRRIYSLDFALKLELTFQNINVYTINDVQLKKIMPPEPETPAEVHGIEIPKRKEFKSEFGYLLIDATCEIEEYDSLGEGSANIRPHLLIIYGIITFLTDHVFLPFQSFGQLSSVIKEHIKPVKNNVLKFEGKDLSDDFNKIISAINSSDPIKRNLIYSVFDRWRKARYHEQESEESLVYTDESILAYVHVLEVLSDEYKKELSASLKSKRKALIEELVIYSNTTQVKSEQKIKTLVLEYSLLQITLREKIETMLKEFGLYNLKTAAIVGRFIEHRNSIAHGRKDVYKEKLIFPLPPFFSLIKDIHEHPEFIKFLSAKCISSYLDLSSWDLEWKYILSLEFTPLPDVKSFIEEKKYETISYNDFLNGKINEVFPNTIHHYYIKGRLSRKELQNSLSGLFENIKITKTIAQKLFHCAIVLADSENASVAAKAQQMIMQVDKKSWVDYSNIRDVLKYHEYYGKETIWFKNYLLQR